MMKRLRYVVVPGNEVKEGECYLMAAIPSVAKPAPGEIAEIGKRTMNMAMVPCRLEWVTMDDEGNDIEVAQIYLEEIEPPSPIIVPSK